MADTDLIENVILFTRLCERPSDELRRAGVKLETNTLAYSGLFYIIGNSSCRRNLELK